MLAVFRDIMNIAQCSGKKVRRLFLLMVAGALLETVSVSFMLPVMNTLLNSASDPVSNYLSSLGANRNTAVVICIVAVIVIYILKNLFSLVIYRYQVNFTYSEEMNLRNRLLTAYLSRPYESWLALRSGDVIRIVSDDTGKVFSLLLAMLSALSTAAMCLLLCLTMLFIEPVLIACVALVLLLCAAVIRLCVHPVLKRLGKEAREASSEAYHWILRGINGIKDIKILHAEKFVEDSYAAEADTALESRKRYTVLNACPKYIIETAAVCSAFTVFALFILKGRDPIEMLPQLSVLLLASIKLLPGVNRIVSAYNSLSYNRPFLEKLKAVLAEAVPEDVPGESLSVFPEDPFRPVEGAAIELRGISYSYPASGEEVLKNVSAELPFFRTIGIIGPSGAGKSTALDLMLGLLEPSGGEILVNGTDIRSAPSLWHSHIGYIPQSVFLCNESIRANTAFGEKPEDIDDDLVWECLRNAQLDGLVKSLPDGLDTRIGERGLRLSGGERQRLGIARALYRRPDILIMDEATSSLDLETEKAITDALNCFSGEKTVIIVSHRPQTVENCDIIFNVENGKITKL